MFKFTTGGTKFTTQTGTLTFYGGNLEKNV